MSIFGRLFKKAPPPPPDVVETIRAVPAGINADQKERIEQAKYRLGAIVRHIETTGRVISDQRRGEFIREARVHIANLMHVDEMSPDVARDYADRIGI